MNEKGITFWVGICLLAAFLSLGGFAATILTIYNVKTWSEEQSRLENDTAAKRLKTAEIENDTAKVGAEVVRVVNDWKIKEWELGK